MNDFIEQSYLERPLIKDVSYEITDEWVSINSPNTCYLATHLPDRLQKDTLLKKYKLVLQEARAKKFHISYQRHIKKTITERWAEYEAACKNMEAAFRRLVEQAKAVQRRGLHMGTCNDEELKRLEKIDAELLPYTYRGSVIFIMSEVDLVLSDLAKELSQPVSPSERYRMIML